MKFSLIAFFFAVSAASVAQSAPAASTTAAPVKDPITAAIRLIMPNRQKNILAAIDAMPADKFSYKPTADQMTFGHLVVHIVESNYNFCSKAADVAAPKLDELKDTDAKDKLSAAAKASFDFCADAVGKMSDAKMGDTITLFGSLQAPRSMAAFVMGSSWADHYGAAAMYLRLNGILPPSAKK